MSGSREATLAAIRRALGRGPVDAATEAALRARLAQPPVNLLPARGQLDPEARLALFRTMAEEVSATVDRVADAAAVPEAVAAYLTRMNLPAGIVASPDPALDRYPWDRRPMLKLRRGVPEAADPVGLTEAVAGVAETGSVAVHSGPDLPITLNVLPETHIVLLPADRVVGAMEQAWALLRRRFAATGGDPADWAAAMPRSVMFITGPSRSADIEQTLQLGAHGPRHLHIILIGDPGRDPEPGPPGDTAADGGD